MTIDQFKANYKLTLSKYVKGDTATFVAEAVERATGKVVATQKVSCSMIEMRDGINASQTKFSITPLTPDDIVDGSYRFATDLLFQLAQIQDYFPLNRDNNIYELLH